MANIRIKDYNYESTSVFMFMFNAASGNYGPNLIIGYHFFSSVNSIHLQSNSSRNYQRES